jgi:hypothetical protein
MVWCAAVVSVPTIMQTQLCATVPPTLSSMVTCVESVRQVSARSRRERGWSSLVQALMCACTQEYAHLRHCLPKVVLLAS